MTEKHQDREELISLSEAADYIGLTHDFLRELARTGKLQARKVGRDWLTTRAAIELYLQTRSPVGRKPKSQRDAWQNPVSGVLDNISIRSKVRYW